MNTLFPQITLWHMPRRRTALAFWAALLAMTLLLARSAAGQGDAINWTGTGHFVQETIGYIPSGYTVQPNFRQASTSTSLASATISSADTADLFINFNFDTTGKTIYLVYTTDGSAPKKDHGTSSTAVFSNDANPNRTWRANIAPQPAGTVVNYVFYASNGALSAAWGRISGTPASRDTSQYETSWNESDNAYFTYTVTSGGPAPITPSGARALWLDANTIAWNGTAGASYRLLYDPDGSLDTTAESSACVFPTPAGGSEQFRLLLSGQMDSPSTYSTASPTLSTTFTSPVSRAASSSATTPSAASSTTPKAVPRQIDLLCTTALLAGMLD